MLATVTAPAAGAPTAQIVIATAMGMIVTFALLGLLQAHKRGRLGVVAWGARLGERLTGLPGWAAVPVGVALVSFASAGLGVWWDISLHIDQGRDSGPLANPAHYFILAGIYGFTAAGVLSLVLHNEDRPSPFAVKLPGIPRLPVGGALLFACGTFSLIGFPLDDVWHRLFGQDVTLWGPTHVMMIAGAIIGIIALMVILVEGQRAAGMDLEGPADSFLLATARYALPGVLLIGFSLWITEFDWGVPQYRQVWQPLLLSAAAASTLIWARIWAGRSGAVKALALYLIARGILHLIVGALGEVQPAMPLFLGEAAAVTVVGLLVGDPKRDALRFGAVAGFAVGAAGFAFEYWWSHVSFPLEWNTALLAEGIPTALIAGTAAGVLGALMACGMRGVLPDTRVARPAAALAGAALLALGVNAAVKGQADHQQVQIAIAKTADGRSAQIAATFSDESKVKDANWLYVISWQGGGMRVEPLHRTAGGVYRTTHAMPISGDWKTSLRLHAGRTMEAISLHHPADTAIGLEEFTAPARSTVPFQDEIQILQAERKDDVPSWLWTVAAALVFAFVLLFLVAVAFGVARIGRPAPGIREEDPPAAPSTKRAPRRLKTAVTA